MAKHKGKADELTEPADAPETHDAPPKGMIVAPDEENTREAGTQGDSGGINLKRRAGGQSPEQPQAPPEAQQAAGKLPDDSPPADLYAEAVALHGKDSPEAARLRLDHQADPGFQAVADWIDRTGTGVLRAATAKPAEAQGARRYRVQLQDNPAHEVQADNPHEAVEKYKAWAGIISTPHKFDVTEL